MMKRRAFIKATAAGTGAILAEGGLPFFGYLGEKQDGIAYGAESAQVHSPRLAKFVDPLPISTPIQPVETVYGYRFYQVYMTQFQQKLHRDLPPTTLWGYNGTFPGPLFDVRINEPILVQWINNLPNTHLLPIDYTLHGAMPPAPDVRSIVHLHGGHVSPENDGNPLNWFVPGEYSVNFYPNQRSAGLLWYHDHAMGITRLNVYAGLVGLYIIRDTIEDGINLPYGPCEIPMVIQDRTFYKNGQLFYPDKGKSSEHPVWNSMFYGDTMLVNGKIWPFLKVEPRKYRFRILNGCNTRFLHLTLSSGQSFCQIGSDGGFLPQPALLPLIIMAPAERADVMIDFSHLAGKTVTLMNTANAPFPGGGQFNIPEIMQFRVARSVSIPDASTMPSSITGLISYMDHPVVRIRDLTLSEELDGSGNVTRLLLNGLPFDAPMTEMPKLGTTEIWRFINLTDDIHPIHVHLAEYNILDRQPFDLDIYKATGQFLFLSSPIPPDENETGLKDVTKVIARAITRIKVCFTDYTGQYVWHCHILEHEDNDMMRPFEVIP